MKKVFSIVLIALVVAFSFAGCANKSVVLTPDNYAQY